MSDLMSSFIQSKGGKLYLNSTVSSLVHDGNGYKAITKDGSVYQGDVVVSTVPITCLKDMLESSRGERNLKRRWNLGL